jgi:hypothetical protein
VHVAAAKPGGYADSTAGAGGGPGAGAGGDRGTRSKGADKTGAPIIVRTVPAQSLYKASCRPDADVTRDGSLARTLIIATEEA